MVCSGALLLLSFPAAHALANALMYPGDDYVPSRSQFGKWWGGSCSEFNFTTSDKSYAPGINCRLKAQDGVPIIMFGGNAMNMYDSVMPESMPSMLPTNVPFNVFSMSLAGSRYAPRTGDFSIEQSLKDANSLLTFVHNQTGKASVLFGWSLGTAVAASIAADASPDLVRCVVLGNPFTSMHAEAAAFLHLPEWLLKPWLGGVALLPTVMWAKTFRAPTAVLASTEDEVIPSSMHMAVYKAVASDTKFIIQEKATHNELRAFVQPLRKFVA
eukprot:CAMPEP_0172916210 /NCGR_PEP_ID=MMETSP1075-20121228/195883_1 /TAXON_ID=2916 /ORGANISM="Ceratium fusus, Strain PA161109" /LENGTH=270 /DNA_ID=CAMNT_0013775459 /DNA_START=140 /DNA_END=949 /DNA_ORIENTATION=-